MDILKKYNPDFYVINDDPVRTSMLDGFQSLLDGKMSKKLLFGMYDDRLMKQYLDTDDYAHWEREKKTFLDQQ